MTTPELWDSRQIADYLRLERKTVLNRVVHEPGFPKPIAAAKRNRLWVKDEVIEHLIRRRAA
ncbi:helix-turn-helix transcriptional regulator [Algiphilus aromaticivorans]|uniref:helix-turn-helix transcriptional regulator n=1 Tax=Algiphilus aromaticivorans TaxID=382454 RepID=UPI0005C2143F|nr:hypothetical protein [Algiphilus aromaticivorans]